MATEPSLAVQIGPLKLRNPVMTASGCFGWGEAFRSFFDLNELGALVGKAVTPEPRAGNPDIRIWETPAGMLNAIGLQNPGVEGFIADILPTLRDLACPIVVNVPAHSIEGYVYVVRRLTEAGGIAAIELNLSCPNVGRGGKEFCVEPESVAEVVRAVRAATSLPLIAKLSPNVTEIVPLALAAEAAGADAVSLVNTLVGMAIDVERRRPMLGNVTGGLSGPAIRPIALRMVYEVAGAVRIPVIGIGGIATTRDALEFLMAGATAIQVGTANFFNPRACPEIIAGLRAWLIEHGIGDVRVIIGAARRQEG